MLNWYADRAKEMSVAIEIATQENCPPHPSRVVTPASARHQAVAKKSKKPTKNHSIHAFPVLGKISAGKMHSVIPPLTVNSKFERYFLRMTHHTNR
ncbi:MAG: hypothetical protein L6461_09325 [Anaerolineae bacterium]|nr:hypothetical protein [Anaerolineae bacterium]